MLILLSLLATQVTPVFPSQEPSRSAFYWIDLEGDGDQDALAVEPGGALRLLRNQGDGSFVESTSADGLGAIAGVAGALLGDVDLDGRVDLVTWGASGLSLWSQGAAGFVESTVSMGLGGLAGVGSAGWVDANGDGRPDLHLSSAGGHRVFSNDASGVFRELDLGLAPEGGISTGGVRSTVSVGAGSGAVLPGVSAAGLGSEDGLAPRDRDRDGSAGAGGSEHVLAPGVVVTQGAFGPPSINAFDCVNSLRDQSGGGCVQASSVPTLGTLYPLGNEFMIDMGTGFVGIGTIAPGYALEVVGQIVSGTANVASGVESAMGGGKLNNASGGQATIAGGESNTASGQGAFVGGGSSNVASSQRAAIGGGVGNRAGYRAFVGGGDNNQATGNLSAVAGGKLNEARQTGGTVNGGENNISDAVHATIAGGELNTASGAKAAIGGGLSNLATGGYGAIPGGRQNTAAGAYSLAAGRRAKAVHDGAFVWADSTDADFSSTAPDQVAIRAGGGMGVGKVPDPSFQLDIEGALRVTDTIVSTKPTGAPFSVASNDLNANLNADLLDGLDAGAFSQFGTEVETRELADGAVTASKLAAAAVDSAALSPGSVTAAAIAAGAVTASELADDSVGALAIAAGAVGTSEVADGSLSGIDVQDGSLTELEVAFSQLIVDGEVESTSGGFRFPDGTRQTTAMPSGSMILKSSTQSNGGFSYSGLYIVAQKETSGWEALAPIPSGRYGHAAVSSTIGQGTSSSLFVIGGFGSSGPVADVSRYDLASDSWSLMSSMPGGARGFLGSASARFGTERVWAVGGLDDLGDPVDAFEEFDLIANTWSTRASLPSPRYGLSVAFTGSSSNQGLYAIGGRTASGAPSDLVQFWDRNTDTWTTRTPMPTARAFAATGFVGGKIYVVGGSLDAEPGDISGLNLTAVVEVYDTQLDSWSTLTPFPEPVGGAAGEIIDNLMYVYGGRTAPAIMGDPPVSSSKTYYLSPSAIWTEVAALTPEREHSVLEWVSGEILAVGGRDSQNSTPLSNLDRLEPAEDILYVHTRD